MQISKPSDSSSSIWKFDHERLMPGDVVLERGDGLTSKGIKAIDRGRYSHALLWLDGTDFLEAVGMGVRLISYARFFIRSPSDWTVLRHPDAKLASLAAQEARSFAHMKYGLGGAIATKTPGSWKTDPTKMFCSQVVAAAYEHVGAPLVGKPATKVSPNDLLRASILRSVTPPPLVEQKLSPEELAGAKRWFDRDKAYAGTAMAREVAVSQEVFELVVGLFPTIATPPELRLSCPPRNLGEALNVIQFLDWTKASEISHIMVPALERRGYFDFLTKSLEAITQRLQQQNADLAAGRLDPVLMLELTGHYETVVTTHVKTQLHHRNNADTYDALYRQRFPLPLFSRLARMHRAIEASFTTIIRDEWSLISGCRTQLSAANPASSA